MIDPYELKRFVSTVLSPPAGPILLAALGLASIRRRPTFGRSVAVVGLASAWLLSTPAMTHLMAVVLESGLAPLDSSAWEARRVRADSPQAVVLLGGGIGEDKRTREGRLTTLSLQRVVAGAGIARMTGLPVLVSGGGRIERGDTEAGMVASFLQDEFRVQVRWREEGSRDTIDQALRSAEMLRAEGIGSVVLVTHAYHMPRSRRVFEAAGLVVTPAPHDWLASESMPLDLYDWIPSVHAVRASWLAFHELVGLLWYRIRGHA